jgi:hypothetical protein
MIIRLLKITFLLTLISSSAFGFSKETTEIKSQFTDEVFKVSVLSQSEAEELFAKFTKNSLMHFNLVSDGCYARAYLMIAAAQLKEVYMVKRVVEVINKTEATINITIPNQPWILRWYYHVAPMLYVRNENSNTIQEMIFDPSLFNRPITKNEFIEALSNNKRAKLDSFILPAYVSEKDQLSTNVNLRRLDNSMLIKLAEATEFAKTHGQYLEKTALYDGIQKKCYKGGFEMPIEDCTK